MRTLFLTASVMVGLASGAAAVEMTKPFEALEESRRARLELDKRMAQEKAKQLRAEREQKAKEAAEAKRVAAEKKRNAAAKPSTGKPN
jgi:hypothetical protein